eukprot:3950467-Prymnesium_polylepis.1
MLASRRTAPPHEQRTRSGCAPRALRSTPPATMTSAGPSATGACTAQPGVLVSSSGDASESSPCVRKAQSVPFSGRGEGGSSESAAAQVVGMPCVRRSARPASVPSSSVCA